MKLCVSDIVAGNEETMTHKISVHVSSKLKESPNPDTYCSNSYAYAIFIFRY